MLLLIFWLYIEVEVFLIVNYKILLKYIFMCKYDL